MYTLYITCSIYYTCISTLSIWANFYVSNYQSRTFFSKEAGWAILCHCVFSGIVLCLIFLSRLHSETPSFIKHFPISLPRNTCYLLYCLCSIVSYTLLHQYLCFVSTLIYFTICCIFFLNCDSFKKGTVSPLVLTPSLAHNRNLRNVSWTNVRHFMLRNVMKKKHRT